MAVDYRLESDTETLILMNNLERREPWLTLNTKTIGVRMYRELHGNLSLWSVTSNDSRYAEVGHDE